MGNILKDGPKSYAAIKWIFSYDDDHKMSIERVWVVHDSLKASTWLFKKSKREDTKLCCHNFLINSNVDNS